MCILLNYTERKNNNNSITTNQNNTFSRLLLRFILLVFVLDGHRMWTNALMNVEHRQMITYLLLVLLFVSLNQTNEITDNKSNMTLERNVMPIEKFLHQQLDNRQMSLNQTPTTIRIRPWKKSNSIEILKKMIANRQRSTNTSRMTMMTTTTTTTTTTTITTSTSSTSK